jgi:hypothetical protein
VTDKKESIVNRRVGLPTVSRHLSALSLGGNRLKRAPTSRRSAHNETTPRQKSLKVRNGKDFALAKNDGSPSPVEHVLSAQPCTIPKLMKPCIDVLTDLSLQDDC